MEPEQLAKAGTEHAHQAALFCWSRSHEDVYPGLDMLFAVPNGGERNIIVAGKMKAEGVRAGVPDICLPVPRLGFHSLWIEMKKPSEINKIGGGCSAAQEAYSMELIGHGAVYHVCYDWISAAEVLAEYLCGGHI